jgi:hypothetical protein
VLTLTTTKGEERKLKADLNEIFQIAINVLQAFQTQNASFTVSFPLSTRKGGVNYDGAEMEDKKGSIGEGVKGRKVGLLIFPGVFKTVATVRDCLVKTRVVCVDEMGK